MSELEILQRCVDQTGRIVAGVKPDQLETATPCTDWNVRTLLSHTIAAAEMFSVGARGQELDFSIFGQDLCGEDPAGAYDQRAKKLRDALSAPDVLDHNWNMPFGSVPSDQGVAFATLELAQHSWDIARATGQDVDFDAEVTAVAFGAARAAPPEVVRQKGVFGPERDAPATVPEHDQLAAFLGRQG
jgi:uncharacterized protein (TIGR03086 family)